MIDILSGSLVSRDKSSVVLMVGGVGFRVNVPKSVFDIVEGTGQALTLYTHLAVREDSLTLYGFATEEDRGLFDILLTVSGVGPKVALSILSTLSTDHLRHAVAREESDILARVPGIGKKTAEKIIFELKNKLGTAVSLGLPAISDTDTDVVDALIGLGYSVVEAQSALQRIPRDAPKDFETRFRLALEYFS
jgi:holliday junction DNA helicase RuvA